MSIKLLSKSQRKLLKSLLKIIFVFVLHAMLTKNLKSYKETKIDSFKYQVPIKNSPKSITKDTNLKHILFWTPWKDSSYWNMGAKIQGEEYLKSLDCPMTNCIFSHDRNLLPRTTDYDALVFYVGDSVDTNNLPLARREDQIYIMANKESPFDVKENLKFYENFFNMTFTYRLDSDIFWNSGVFVDRTTESVVAPSRFARWRKPEIVDDPDILDFITTSKTSLVVWPLSKCGTESNYDQIGMKILEFMDVDVYGKCRNFSHSQVSIAKRSQKFTEMLNSTYKFCFTFEDSICVDYMTEQVFLTMENYIVPVLFNGITDMQHFLPPHSYIHVNDFNSVEDLVNYIKYLDKNPQEYANYFWWKKYYKIIPNASPYAFCNMCLKVTEWNAKQKRQAYFDVNKWFNNKTCFNMDEFF